MKGRVGQEGLQALCVHIEEGLHIHSCLVKYVELQKCKAPAESTKELHQYPLCLLEVPGGTQHLQCLAYQLLLMPLAHHQLPIVPPTHTLDR